MITSYALAASQPLIVSVAMMVKSNVPAKVGVPMRLALEPLPDNITPFGSAPAVTVKL